MTRAEAAKELLSERSDTAQAISDIGWQIDYWFSTAVTERLARREAETERDRLSQFNIPSLFERIEEAEERVKFLDAAVDEALKDRDYYHKKLEQAEESVKELEEGIKDLVTGLDHQLDETNVLRARVKELEDAIMAMKDSSDTKRQAAAWLKLATLVTAVHPWACTCTACQNGETQKGEKQP